MKKCLIGLIVFLISLQANGNGFDVIPALEPSKISFTQNYKWQKHHNFKSVDNNGKVIWSSLEGKVFKQSRYMTDNTQPVEIFRNYQQALKDAGFTISYQCNPCHYNALVAYMEKNVRGDYLNVNWNNGDVSLLVANNPPLGLTLTLGTMTFAGYTEYHQDWVKTELMESQRIILDARKITQAFKTRGTVVLDGIFFDTGSARITTKSQDTIKTIAAYIKQNPGNYAIVGHTDNTGKLSLNMRLSKERAQAVVNTLKQAGISNISNIALSSHGLGPLSPRTTNTSTTGRTQNRRVELVLLQ